MATKTFIALTGLNYMTATGEVRVEAGHKVNDLPAKSVTWLRDQGLIVDPKEHNASDAAPVEKPIAEEVLSDAVDA